MIKKIIGSIILMNWELEMIPKEQVQGTVVVASPHTSNWDFLYTIGVFWKLELDMKFLIKDSYTKSFFFGKPIKWFGGIGVNRSQKNDLISYCAELFKKDPKLILIVPAEGTRTRSEKWKLGFYYIALKANVPISLGYLDYAEKRKAGIAKLVYPNKKDKGELFKEIEDFYKTKQGKYPENFTPNIE